MHKYLLSTWLISEGGEFVGWDHRILKQQKGQALSGRSRKNIGLPPSKLLCVLQFLRQFCDVIRYKGKEKAKLTSWQEFYCLEHCRLSLKTEPISIYPVGENIASRPDRIREAVWWTETETGRHFKWLVFQDIALPYRGGACPFCCFSILWVGSSTKGEVEGVGYGGHSWFIHCDSFLINSIF